MRNRTRGGGSGRSRTPSGSGSQRPGTFEHAHSWMYPNVSEETASQKARFQSPKLSFVTDTDPMACFRSILSTLSKGSFSRAIMYDGPELGLSDETPEFVEVGEVVGVLKGKDGEAIPMTGLKAVLVYDKGAKVRAKVRVSGRSRTKVRVKVRGAVEKADWNMVRHRIRKRFHVEV